jgi:hypothetical protein
MRPNNKESNFLFGQVEVVAKVFMLLQMVNCAQNHNKLTLLKIKKQIFMGVNWHHQLFHEQFGTTM